MEFYQRPFPLQTPPKTFSWTLSFHFEVLSVVPTWACKAVYVTLGQPLRGEKCEILQLPFPSFLSLYTSGLVEWWSQGGPNSSRLSMVSPWWRETSGKFKVGTLLILFLCFSAFFFPSASSLQERSLGPFLMPFGHLKPSHLCHMLHPLFFSNSYLYSLLTPLKTPFFQHRGPQWCRKKGICPEGMHDFGPRPMSCPWADSCRSLASGSPRPPPDSLIHWENSQDSAHSHDHS